MPCCRRVFNPMLYLTIKTKWKLNWGVYRFKLLETTFDTDRDKTLTLNFTDKIANIIPKNNYWNRRSLTPIGRISGIKSLLLLSLNHLFISLPNPNEKLLKDLNALFFNFIWTGTSRIKKTVLCQEYCNGRLKMANMNAFIAALKTNLLKKIITDNNSPWSIILLFMTDIKNNDGSIYTYDELKATYNVTINFLQYSGLVRSILVGRKHLI